MARLQLNALTQTYLDDFCLCFGVRIAVYDETGRELASGLDRSLCDYCRVRRRDPLFAERCLASDARARRWSQTFAMAVAYRCHGRLTEAIRCLKIDGCTAGWVMIGQFRCDAAAGDASAAARDTAAVDPLAPPEAAAAVDPLAAPADAPAVGPLSVPARRPVRTLDAAATAAYYQLPHRPMVLLRPMLSIFDKLVDHMLASHGVQLLEDLFVARAQRYLNAHLDRQVDLRAAAVDLGISVSGLCHRFKAETGRSFIATHRRLRVEHAVDLLRSGRCPTVKAAAAAAGFDDPLHFSRLAAAVLGYPPSAVKPI